jgi:hypothetical protein
VHAPRRSAWFSPPTRITLILLLLATAKASLAQAPSSEDTFDVRLKPPVMGGSGPIQFIIDDTGTLEPSAKQTKSFMVPKRAAMSALMIANGVTWSFRTPGGEVIVPGNAEGHDDGGALNGLATFSLENPEPCEWTVEVASSSDTSVNYGLQVQTRGSVDETAHIETMLGDSGPDQSFRAQPGDPVFVRVFVANRGQSLPGMHWRVQALTPRDSLIEIPVFDDGMHADGEAGDGVSVGAVVAEGPDGRYRLRAEGRTPLGDRYVTVAMIEVQSKSE